MSFIETERLILRTWMHSDVDAAARLLADPDVTRFLPGGVRTRDVAVAWIEAAMHEQDREGFAVWPMILKAGGGVIGWCGLHRMADGLVEVEWALERGAWEMATPRRRRARCSTTPATMPTCVGSWLSSTRAIGPRSASCSG